MENQSITPVETTAAARELWLAATSQQDLDEVERLYRWALSSKTDEQNSDGGGNSKSTGEDGNDEEPPKKKVKSGDCGLTPKQFTQAGEKLALLLCQSGRCKKAKKGLASMGFTCRLSEQVLDYPCEDTSSDESSDDGVLVDEIATKQKSKAPCQIIDGFLSQSELQRLRSVFAPLTASYWTDHNYSVEPPSPYFSYVIPLDDIIPSDEESGNEGLGNNRFGFLGQLIQKMLTCPLLNEKFPKLESKANFVELWAHNRPHASGHQMHFDSDDEGRGGIRNPIVSTILYITEEDSNEATANGNQQHAKLPGGPSLVTNQRLTDIRLATKGWMAHPKPQRLVAFDGKYLHGVVPGKGAQTGRRVTLMLAFWESIQMREGTGPGSARPFPTTDVPEWANQLVAPLDGTSNDGVHDYESCVETAPINLGAIYETLDGKAWKRGRGMPSYDQVFQGF